MAVRQGSCYACDSIFQWYWSFEVQTSTSMRDSLAIQAALWSLSKSTLAGFDSFHYQVHIVVLEFIMS